MANSLPRGPSEVESTDLFIKIELHSRSSTGSGWPELQEPADAKREDRDPPDPMSTSGRVRRVPNSKTRMRLFQLDSRSSLERHPRSIGYVYQLRPGTDPQANLPIDSIDRHLCHIGLPMKLSEQLTGHTPRYWTLSSSSIGEPSAGRRQKRSLDSKRSSLISPKVFLSIEVRSWFHYNGGQHSIRAQLLSH